MSQGKTCSLILMLCLVLAPFPAWAAEAPPQADQASQKLAEVLETDQRLDDELRRLALDAGQGVNFTLAAGRGLRSDTLRKLVAVYREVLRRYPENPLAAAGLARSLAGLGQNTQALAAYEKAARLNPADRRLKAELESLRLRRAPLLRSSVVTTDSREYWPLARRHIYRVLETTWQVQAETQVGDSWRLGAGHLEGRIRQGSFVYGDRDYLLNRSGVFIRGTYKARPDLTLDFRLRREVFSADNQNSYYQMQDDKELWTGHVLAQYLAGPWWLNFSFSRERDPWPMVEPSTGRGVLRVVAQELMGLAAGRALGRGWESNFSLFYEQYGSDRPDQFNLNGQVLHRPAWLPSLRLGLGVGHYTEEPETLLNLLAGWQWSPAKSLALDLSGQLERTSKENSWLTVAQVLLSWRPLSRLGFTCLASWGQEHGDDRDDWWSVDFGIEIRF